MKPRRTVVLYDSPLLLPEDYTEEFEGAVLIRREEGRLIVRQAEGVCIICGEPAMDWLFGKGVCRVCINHAKLVRERGY